MNSEDDDGRGGSSVEDQPDCHASSSSPEYSPFPMYDSGPPDPEEKVDVPYEGHVNEEEELRGGAEEDEAPLPPEAIAASFEEHRDEKDRHVEDGDEEAPCPPESIAASHEVIDGIDQEAKKKSSVFIEDGTAPRVPDERIAFACETEENISIIQDIGRLHEINNDETPATMNDLEVPLDPSLFSYDHSHYTATNVQDGALSIAPTHQGDNGVGLATGRQGRMEIQSLTTEELVSPPRLHADPNNQSLPLLEATLVQDVPNEPIYIYINTNLREDGTVYDAIPVRHGWLRNNKAAALVSVSLAIAAIITGITMNEVNKNGSMNTSAPSTAPSIWKQRGEIVGEKDLGDRLGSSVALSKNATIMVIGAPEYKTKMGYVKAYRTVDDGGTWNELDKTIYGNSTEDMFGTSVDITADGTIIICGSPGNSDAENRPGYVRVFELSESDNGTATWVQLGQNITGAANGDWFGHSVSISDDGKTIAIGAPYFDGMNGTLKDSGHVRIFNFDDEGERWEKIGANVDIEGDAAKDGLGCSVSLSGNGTIVAIGAPLLVGANKASKGQVKVYRINRAESSWKQLGESIYGENGYNGVVRSANGFGRSVDVSLDGNAIAIGSSSDGRSDDTGYVRAFHISSGDWTKVGEVIKGKVAGDNFGYSVSLSDDGKTIAVGAWGNDGINEGDNMGHVIVYRMNNSESGWARLGEDINGEYDKDYSGWAVSLSGDGNTVAIGSPRYDSDSGEGIGRVLVMFQDSAP